MSVRVHTTEVDRVAVHVVPSAALPALYGEAFESLVDDRHALVIDDPMNCEAFVVLGSLGELVQLGATGTAALGAALIAADHREDTT